MYLAHIKFLLDLFACQKKSEHPRYNRLVKAVSSQLCQWQYLDQSAEAEISKVGYTGHRKTQDSEKEGRGN